MNAPDDSDPRYDLEEALRRLDGLAQVMKSLDDADREAISYLADRLQEHHDDAHDAFSRIFKLDEYREQEAQS
jgi:hypothetical protein